MFKLTQRGGNLWDILFVFPPETSILLIEDYNDATTLGRYPSDFFEYDNCKDQAAHFGRDSVAQLWRFMRVVRMMIERVKPDNSKAMKLPDIKIMFQERVRLAEFARGGDGIVDRGYSPI